MEKALRNELNQIPQITNKIYPLNAPKGKKAPYLVYISYSRPMKDLDGTKSDINSDVLLNIFSDSYSEMKDLTKKVKKLIDTFLFRNIGEQGPYIEDLTIEKITETYESELELYRGIIPFNICYKEE